MGRDVDGARVSALEVNCAKQTIFDLVVPIFWSVFLLAQKQVLLAPSSIVRFAVTFTSSSSSARFWPFDLFCSSR
jgi:hypothetical protein